MNGWRRFNIQNLIKRNLYTRHRTLKRKGIFHNPAVTMEVIDGIEAYMKKNGFESVKDMVGIVK